MGRLRNTKAKSGTISTADNKQTQVEGAKHLESSSPRPQRRTPARVHASDEGQAQQIPAARASPLRRSTGAAKKPAGQDAKKSIGPSIHSFFNAATEKHKAARAEHDAEAREEEPSRPAVIGNDSDIEDAEDSSQLNALSQGSSVALAMRKRKFNEAQDSQKTGVVTRPTASQKFLKTNSGLRASSHSVRIEDQRPWTERFAPLDLNELVVHKRKVADVRQWLQSSLQGRRQKVLVLRGAAGTGKTTTISLLARDLKADLIEWRDPTAHGAVGEDSIPIISQFEDFIGRAGKASTLHTVADVDAPPSFTKVHDSLPERSPDAQPKILLVEEFPSTFLKGSAALHTFRSAIAQFASTVVPSGTTPSLMVMVVSETLLSTNTAAADSFTVHRLLGPELMANPYVNVIEFNPVAPTLVTKALELVVLKEARKSGRRKTPGQSILKHLASTGDIRSAVSTLEYICLRGDDEHAWSGRVTFTKPKQTKSQPPLTAAEQEIMKLVSNRESTIGIFHSVGKVVYNKREEPSVPSELEQPPSWLPQHKRMKVPDVDADLLINELGTDTNTFLAALHENYALSCCSSAPGQSVDSLSSCMDALSDADLLSFDRFSPSMHSLGGSTASNGLRQDEMCFHVAVRGLLFNLPSPVHRGTPSSGRQADAHRMFYPASLKAWRRTQEISEQLEALIVAMQIGNHDAGSTTDTSNASGIEGWKQRTSFDKQETASSDLDGLKAAVLRRERKATLLLERLPYAALIMHHKRSAVLSDGTLDRILKLTRISGTDSNMNDDEESDHEDDVMDTAVVAQWTTDLPATERDATKVTRQTTKLSRPAKSAFEVARVTPVVDGGVARLTLEEDEIVDD